MSQTGFTPILLYASGTATNTPLAANLTSNASGAELAINYADGKLFYKDSGGFVQVLATKGAAQNSISFGTTGLTPSTATQGVVTVAGTLITSNGGTGLSSYTAGDLPYYASGTALSKLGIGTAGQILTSTGSAPQWSNLSSALSGILTVSNGGTGQSSLATGSIGYGQGTSAHADLAIGTAGQVLTVNSGATAPIWTSASLIVGGAAGSNTQIQYNNAGSLGASSAFTFDGVTIVSPSHTANTATTGSTKKGPFNYGTLSFSDTGIVQSAQTSVNSYFQNVIQNTSAGAAASAEFIAYNDQGTATTNYATVGINSSGYTGTGSINAAGYGYFLTASTDLVLGTIGANGIHFTTNSSASDALAISSTGVISIPSSGTANGVAYLNGSKQLTTGSALTFDGSILYTSRTTDGIIFNARGTSNAQLVLSVNSGVLQYDASNGSAVHSFLTNSIEAMRLTSKALMVGYTSDAGFSGSFNAGIAGSLGIGTSSPAAKLDVNGGALIQGLTVGRGGSAVATNTATGYLALQYNTTGNYNTANGYAALQYNTTGSNNTANGYIALQSNTTGIQNTANGREALYYNTTGSYNTASGVSALYYNTTGSNNTASGVQALFSNTIGSYNTAVGYQAGYSATGGSCVFLGFGAGQNATTGVYNTFVGRNAGSGYLTTMTGSNNTFVGDSSGTVVSSGSKNTILGAYTGNQGGLDIRTASNYIVLSDGNGTPWASLNNGTLSLAGISTGDVGGISFKNNANAQSWSIAANSSDFYIANASFSKYASLVGQSFTSWTFASDRRIKKDIVDIEYGLDSVMAMKPRKYKMLSSDESNIGFIAQELKTIIPEAVTGEEIEYLETDTPQQKAIKTMGVSKDLLIPVLVKAIQEQQAIIEDMKTRLAAAGI